MYFLDYLETLEIFFLQSGLNTLTFKWLLRFFFLVPLANIEKNIALSSRTFYIVKFHLGYRSKIDRTFYKINIITKYIILTWIKPVRNAYPISRRIVRSGE